MLEENVRQRQRRRVKVSFFNYFCHNILYNDKKDNKNKKDNKDKKDKKNKKDNKKKKDKKDNNNKNANYKKD